MQNIKRIALSAGALALLGSIGTWMDHGSASLRADGGPSFTLAGPIPLPTTISNTPDVHVTNTPSVTLNGTPNVHVTNTPSVTVGNLVSMPVIGSLIDDPGRVAYRSTLGGASGTNDLQFHFPAVPAGHRLVVTEVTGRATLLGNDVVEVQLSGNGVAGPDFFLPPSASVFGISSRVTAFAQPVVFYLDAGDAPDVLLNDLANNAFTDGARITLTGYMLDCSAAPCSPIAQ